MTQYKIPIWLSYEEWLKLTEVLLRSELMLKENEVEQFRVTVSKLFRQTGHYAKMMTWTSRTER